MEEHIAKNQGISCLTPTDNIAQTVMLKQNSKRKAASVLMFPFLLQCMIIYNLCTYHIVRRPTKVLNNLSFTLNTKKRRII